MTSADEAGDRRRHGAHRHDYAGAVFGVGSKHGGAPGAGRGDRETGRVLRVPSGTTSSQGLPVVLTCKEVAIALRTSPKAVYTMVERRQLPCVRLGRRVLFIQDELLDWLRQKSTPSLER